MREFIVASKDAGRKIERWMPSVAPGLSIALTMRFLRLKRVRVNGRPAREGVLLETGDEVRMYIEDEYFAPRKRENKLLSGFRPRIDAVYEDENVLIVDKRPGLRAHPDDEEKVDTLVTHIQAYLYQKGEYSGEGFAPALCNRIDRFTGGLVIAAKNPEALHIIDMKIRDREIRKFYLCAAFGRLAPREGAFKGYLLKEGRHVRAIQDNAPGAQYAETRYRTLAFDGEATLAECELMTGRTHQIRVQFAAAGHPLIGDTQYGSPAINAKYQSGFQQLYSYKLTFDFKSDAGAMEYLNGKTFRVKKLHRGFEEISKRAGGEFPE